MNLLSKFAFTIIAAACALNPLGATAAEQPASPSPGGEARSEGELSSTPPRTSEYDYEPPTPGTYQLPIIRAAADGDILDSDGHRLRLHELTHGRITILSFIYTRCADSKACPYATGVLNQLHRQTQHDPTLARELRLVSMSFDPEIDTPARMKLYSSWAQNREHTAEWSFVTTRSQKELNPILQTFGQVVDRKQNPADPTGPLSHNLRVFLIDRDANIRNIYSSGTLDLRLILADIQTLLLEQTKKQTARTR